MLVALIALVVAGAAVFLASRTSDKFTDAGNAINSDSGGGPCGTDQQIYSMPGGGGVTYTCMQPNQETYGVFVAN